MTGPMNITTTIGQIKYDTLIKQYENAQASLAAQMSNIKLSGASAGQFLLLQFQMGNMAQVGETISNMISSLMNMIMNSIRNLGKLG